MNISNYYTPYNVSIDPAQVQSSLNGKNVAPIAAENNCSKWKYYVGITLIALGFLGVGLGVPVVAVFLAKTTAQLAIISIVGTVVCVATGGFGVYLSTDKNFFSENDQPPSYEQTLLSPPDYYTPSYGQVVAPPAQHSFDPTVPPPAYS